MDDRPMSPLAAEIAMLRRLAAVEAKLAAAEAKVAQCREVLREREFPYWNEHTGLHYCSSCYAQKGIFSREPHIQECAWKRAMEDA